ncbi:queuine trna ribosyl transferase [Cystoisospora suis]|uniref:Queuine trna ribosyl transferase n=1 Tax=Cystoisospora suis TaxID=483139 RepID=A0A2C6L929_9APIC|nr:queuine trna ribosyl transferase [Cystoisospora suis]
MQISPARGIHAICLLFLSHLVSLLLRISVVQVASFSSQSSLFFPTFQNFASTRLPYRSPSLATTRTSSPLLSMTTRETCFSLLFPQELRLPLSFPRLHERARGMESEQRQPCSSHFFKTSLLLPCGTYYYTQITRTGSPLFSSWNFSPLPVSVSEEEKDEALPSLNRDFSRGQRLSTGRVLEGQHAMSSSQGKARLGMIHTVFGNVQTPNFIFCGTKAAVKGVSVDALRDAGTQIILANTYHLLAFPGPDAIERMGGLQHFTGWHGPMFTDSGGYQIFSLHYGGVADEIKGRRRKRVKSRQRDQKKTPRRHSLQYQRSDNGEMRRIDCGVRAIDCGEISKAETAIDASGSLKSSTRRSESDCLDEKEKDRDFLVSGEKNPLSKEDFGLPSSSDDSQTGVTSVENRKSRDGNSQEKGDGIVINEEMENRVTTGGATVEEDSDAPSLLLGLNEDGATFRSYHTGEVIQLTPEMAMKTQRQLGADLIVALDECTPFSADKTYTAESMYRSHRWELRCLDAFEKLRRNDPPSVFPKFSLVSSTTATSCSSSWFPSPSILSPCLSSLPSSVDSTSLEPYPARHAIQKPRTTHPSYSPDKFCLHADDENDHGGEERRRGRRKTRMDSFKERCPICRNSQRTKDLKESEEVAICERGSGRPPVVHYPQQGLYGVVQGGVHPDLRRESVAFVNEHAFFGAAIGGSLGADRQQMHAVVAETAAQLRRDRPIHLLGIGGMRDIFHGVLQGIDTFDCVHPTRAGRHGSALVPRTFWDADREGSSRVPPSATIDSTELRHVSTSIGEKRGEGGDERRRIEREGMTGEREEAMSRIEEGSRGYHTKRMSSSVRVFPIASQTPKEYIDLRNAAFKYDDRPILGECRCSTCQNHSRGYLHYLLKSREHLGGYLVTVHNIYTMNRLMFSIRKAIRMNCLINERDLWIHPDMS